MGVIAVRGGIGVLPGQYTYSRHMTQSANLTAILYTISLACVVLAFISVNSLVVSFSITGCIPIKEYLTLLLMSH